jgi:DNA adenine methylase
MKIRFLKYIGSKFNYVDLINEEINKTSCNIYIEPFLGSGAIALNLEKQFNKIIGNDIDKNIIKVWQAFKSITYYDFINFYKKRVLPFGDIKNNKESYYNFRDTNNLIFSETNSIEEGLFYFFLNRSAINGSMRFGKKGFNGAYGNRNSGLLTECVFNNLKNKINKLKITNVDYEKMWKYDSEKTFYFLDPPYFESKRSIDYCKPFSSKFMFFINDIKNIKGKVLFTYQKNETVVNELKGWRVEKLRDFKHSGFGFTTKNTQEVMYLNF